jgi:hypothetical protein
VHFLCLLRQSWSAFASASLLTFSTLAKDLHVLQITQLTKAVLPMCFSPNPMAYHNFQHKVTILRHIPFGRIMSYPNVWCKTFPNRKSASHLTWRTFDMLQMLSPSSVGQNGSNPHENHHV